MLRTASHLEGEAQMLGQRWSLMAMPVSQRVGASTIAHARRTRWLLTLRCLARVRVGHDSPQWALSRAETGLPAFATDACAPSLLNIDVLWIRLRTLSGATVLAQNDVY